MTLDDKTEDIYLPNTINSEYTDKMTFDRHLTKGEHTLTLAHGDGTFVVDSLLVRHHENIDEITLLKDSDRTNEIVYGVDKYHYVYERMVDYVFSNITDITKYNPNAKWYLKKNNMEATDASSLRPDTIRLEQIADSANNEKDAYILDAKFYRFGTTGSESDLPTTTSIQKQITYGDNIICNLREKENIRNVYNAFILPYNKKNNPFNHNSTI
jgi:hypothetical protein